jgi:hypothetical protein
MERRSCSDTDPPEVTPWESWWPEASAYQALYLLLDKTTLVPATHDAWLTDRLWNERHVAHSRRGACEISTIFVGRRYRVFETMVFWEGHALDQSQLVWATWEEAVEGHEIIVAEIEALQHDDFAQWALEDDPEEPAR